MNETYFQLRKEPYELLDNFAVFIQGNLYSGWIYSPTITVIGIFLGIIIGWNIVLSWKLWKLKRSYNVSCANEGGENDS